MLNSLENKMALITGCDAGLGQAMAVSLAQAGCDIAAVNIVEPLDTKKQVEEAGRKFVDIRADLSSVDSIPQVVEQAVTGLGRIDILVNNAGIIRRADAIEFSEKDWDDVVDLNLKSVFFLSQAVARQFIEQGEGGKIVNIASMLSFQGGVRVPSYTASKSGIMGITRLMANEWGQHGINVNAIAPGYMETKATEALRNDKERSAEILARIPANRWGKPEDVSGACLFLSSSLASYINGYTIAVDGGWLAR